MKLYLCKFTISKKMAQKVYLKWSYKSDLIKSWNCCIAHLSRTQNHWQPGSKECNMFFKNESICYFNIFHVVFIWYCMAKKWGGPVPPGPPGFDATVENVFLHTMILGQPQYPDLWTMGILEIVQSTFYH